MKVKMTLGAVCALGLVAPGQALASAPVQVEVLTGDNEDSLFQSPPDGDAADEKVMVESTKSSKGDGKNQNVNTNTQVVNVTIEGGKVTTSKEAEREKTIRELEDDMAEARKRIDEHRARQEETSSAPPEKMSLKKAKEPKQNWWNAGARIKKGDFAVTTRVGDFNGLGLGYFLTDRLSLQLNVGFDKLKGEDDPIQDLDTARKESRFFVPSFDGQQIGGLSESQNVTNALSWMVDLGANYHVVSWKYFGAYVGAGVSSFNYYLNQDDGDGVLGGSIYGRANAGLHWQWKRLFGGIEAAWYPYEIARYLPEEPGGDVDFVDLSKEERTDGERVTGTFFMGIRL